MEYKHWKSCTKRLREREKSDVCAHVSVCVVCVGEREQERDKPEVVSTDLLH